MRWILVLLLGASCAAPADDRAAVVVTDTLMRTDSANAFAAADSHKVDGTLQRDTALELHPAELDTKGVSPEKVVAFARTLIGTPYVYASSDPAVGFDCSGFITYVFNHFGIAVPRSSVDFTPVGQTVTPEEALTGDLILFTGTLPEERHVGHMGIVTGHENGVLQFIHSTSGKKMGVTMTPLNEYYQKRFVRVARVFDR